MIVLRLGQIYFVATVLELLGGKPGLARRPSIATTSAVPVGCGIVLVGLRVGIFFKHQLYGLPLTSDDANVGYEVHLFAVRIKYSLNWEMAQCRKMSCK